MSCRRLQQNGRQVRGQLSDERGRVRSGGKGETCKGTEGKRSRKGWYRIMKKSTFVAMILGTIGGILFALGMCMALIPEWNAFRPGVIMGVAGGVVLLIMAGVWRKMENKEPIKLSGKAVGTTLIGITGALLLGVGMCLTMVWSNMILGILLGIVGIAVLLGLIPFVKGIK